MSTLGIYSSASFVDDSGRPALAGSALVEVRRESDGALASIFSDRAGTSALGNPFVADSEGNFSFYAGALPEGYKVTVTSGSSSMSLRNQPIGTAQYFEADQNLRTVDSPTFTQLTIGTDPLTSSQVATKSYVDAQVAGMDAKASCRGATVANDTLSGLAARDGVTPLAGERWLVRAQTAPAQNGIYITAAGAWARATDMDSWAEVPAAFVYVEEGSTMADTGWFSSADKGGTLGTTAITWLQFPGIGATFQPLDAELTALAGLVSAADKLAYFTGAGTAALTAFAAAARSLLALTAAADKLPYFDSGTTAALANFAAAARSLLALTAAADRLPYFDSGTTAALATFTAQARTLISQASFAAMRASGVLNVDGITGHGDSIYTILATDRVVGLNATLTATRIWTLPLANSVNPGQLLTVIDLVGGISASFGVRVSRNGTDSLTGGNGATFHDIISAFASSTFVSDGVSAWNLLRPNLTGNGALDPAAAGTVGTSVYASRDDHQHRRQLETIPIAASDETTALTTGTKVTFRMPYAFTLSQIRASLTTAQTSGALFTVNVLKGGVTVFSTKITLDNTEKSSQTAATAAVLSTTALADDDEITVAIDQIGDGTAKGLKVYLIGRQSA
jgi:hypothetical protein